MSKKSIPDFEKLKKQAEIAYQKNLKNFLEKQEKQKTFEKVKSKDIDKEQAKVKSCKDFEIVKKYGKTYYRISHERKLQNFLKKNGAELVQLKGEWSGYGYERLGNCVEKSLKNTRMINKYFRENTQEVQLTEEEKIENWCKRLSKLGEITVEDARKIAQEKIEYKEKQIFVLEERNADNYSQKRKALINQIKRSNPLRYIKNKEHAENILIASKRHNTTNYEEQLEFARELVKDGELDACEVKDYARFHKIRTSSN